MTKDIEPQRVAILGGGISGLTTALELSDPAQQGRYAVTVYQMGWRLGGKCASSRNPGAGARVEEHGLHVFFGFYDNTFDLLRRVYAERGAGAGTRFPTVFDALAPHDTISLLEKVDGHWQPWTITCPSLAGRPGDGEPPGPWATVRQVLAWLAGRHGALLAHCGRGGNVQPGHPHWWDRLFGHAPKPEGGEPMDIAVAAAGALPDDLARHLPEHHHRLADLLDDGWRALANLTGAPQGPGTGLRHLIMEADLARAILTGVLREGFLTHPYAATEAANELDFRAWLSRHGALDQTVGSAPVRALYDLIFAYPDGDIAQPGNVEAGSLVNALLQLWQYRGSVIWKMRAGTGEVVIAPIFEVLRKRGVKVEFFSRVTGLVPDSGGVSIRRITLSRQVRLKAATYEPLIDHGGLKCWPNAPLYDQIVEGETLKAKGIDLESRWSGWEDTGGTRQLLAGVDFDVAVLAIPKAGLEDICTGILAQKPAWREMMAVVRTVETQNVQLHLTRDLAGCGWAGPAGTLAGGYDVSPLDTWADISEVLPTEDTGARAQVILCGPLKGPAEPPPVDARDYPARAAATVRTEAERFLSSRTAPIWPAVNGTAGFDWSVLQAPSGVIGPDRLNAQYIRANVDPSERYVQSVAGSSRYRLRADDSGYANLHLAGDWIATPQNLGSFEASVMSGKLASRAVSGLPRTILRVPSTHPLMQRRIPVKMAGGAAPYVVHGGVQTYAGPIRFDQARMWAFMVRADIDRLTALCDKFFAQPSGGTVSYVPLTDRVMLTLTEFPKGRFLNYPSIGFSSEKELAVWVLAGRRKAPDSPVIERIGAFSPYLFLDNPIARSTGREVYGYLKQLGWMLTHGAEGALPTFQVDVYGTPDHGPEAKWGRQKFISLSPVLPGQAADGTTFSRLEDVLGIAGHTLDATGSWLVPGLKLIGQALESLWRGQITQVFLKQFRDIHRTDLACYQAITEAPAYVSGIRGVHHPAKYRFKAHPLANIPMCEDLGLSPDCETDLTLSLTLDMTINPGVVIWEN
ncbi:MAG: FAD-dependent oxidoreductase [Cereibacter sp.]